MEFSWISTLSHLDLDFACAYGNSILCNNKSDLPSACLPSMGPIISVSVAWSVPNLDKHKIANTDGLTTLTNLLT